MGWETLEDAEEKVVAAKRLPVGRNKPQLDLASFLRPSSGSSSDHAAPGAALEPSGGSSNGSRATTGRTALGSQQVRGVAKPRPAPPQVRVIRRATAASRAAAPVSAAARSDESRQASEAGRPGRAATAERSMPPQVSVASAAYGAATGSSPAATAADAAGVAAGRERRKLEQVSCQASLDDS